jgi:tripartite-type tricarboxylate transporter receptor subunit TctC
MAGIKMTHVPYKGTGKRDRSDGGAGATHRGEHYFSVAVRKAGRMRGLAVTSAQRVKILLKFHGR